MTTLLALDNDGVFNIFSKNAKDVVRTMVGPWPITYREDVLARVREILKRPDVTGAWLTKWLEEPALLAELEERLGLAGLVEVRAQFPVPTMTELGVTTPDPAFVGRDGLATYMPSWWKFRSWELLLEDVKPERAAWLDDDLGRAHGKGSETYRPQVTEKLFLYRTHAVAGMLHEDVNKLEAWLDAK